MVGGFEWISQSGQAGKAGVWSHKAKWPCAYVRVKSCQRSRIRAQLQSASIRTNSSLQASLARWDLRQSSAVFAKVLLRR